MARKALLALEDGSLFPCRTFAGSGEVKAEVCFNTSMTGYQEVLTDPSYKGQMVTMTYPLIGNYGVNQEDVESVAVQVSAFLVKEYCPLPSNFRATASLAQYLEEAGVMGVEALDTRMLTKHLRTKGAMQAVLSTEDLDPESLVKKAGQGPGMVGVDLVQEVSCARPYIWEENRIGEVLAPGEKLTREFAFKDAGTKPKVVVIDCGVKFNILRRLTHRDFHLVVVPAKTRAEEILALEPDGVFLSNGPGDPAAVTYVVETVKQLMGKTPIFGICLGHQMIGQALGGSTFKLKFGHRGANQPVKDLATGKVEITSQNHGFCVDAKTITDPDVMVSHLNLNDHTLEGLCHKELPVFCVQYHPEASPGPHDSDYLFDRFRKMMRTGKPPVVDAA
ncbi:glutamine-hydrolyzing carbamoyl-phosphate synthase small subunit [Dethiosulfatarculus sandiegensis]|uniref:Carbamoyl phosphate synthase small chain n=1 Tax=Dethiosulfatarculus sandiegensis TaxID=1429043 RepID=A0A0D2JBQ2_9BACT|nr:glutamine-hydrolyzing carbamoyl-phosphate synthase small subunit [Dethiosulfatarculus sandiegensis]KIX15564.1 carbamoyl phosphate synthase small subunit [Dethiosulfatarculus sandiegensis]